MGVMSCNRKGCDNVMCSDYVEDVGYICSDCLEELEFIKPISKEEVIKFMDTYKDNMNSETKSKMSKLFLSKILR